MEKKILILIALFCVSIVGFAQEAPKVVKAALSLKFPQVQTVIWEQESKHEWEGKFLHNGQEYSANFDNKGIWKATEHEIAKTDIPQIIMETLDKEFNIYVIRKAEISETPSETVYEIGFVKDAQTMEVTITSEGVIYEKEIVDDDDHEEKGNERR